MLFNSFIFFVFLGLVLPIFYFLPNKKSKNIFLVIASYFFYGYWDWRFCLLLLISTIIDFVIGQRLFYSIDPKRRKKLLIISLISNLGILCIFKYFNFFIDSFEEITGYFGLGLDYLHLNIILPVGISFYTFQTLSYTIDVYRNRLQPTNNFIDFALFVSFFPQLVAGPIERAKLLLPQLSKELKPSLLQIKQGAVLIITGLFRKVIIGDTAGRFSDYIFGNLEHFKSIEIIAALVLFSIQIYADFSGYSHIARGTAKLLGVELMKNFEQPYLSRNITEFWRRWHISLSSWLKDYLYISLGGNRAGSFRTYVNLMITMLLGGLWHGASWNFVVWGGLHGLYLSVHKLLLGSRKINEENDVNFNFKDILSVVFTYFLVLFSWIFFRSNSWNRTHLFFEKMFFWESSENAFIFIQVCLCYLFVIVSIDLIDYKFNDHTSILRIKSKSIKFGILLGLFILTLSFMFQTKNTPFIYFSF